jgi:predicted ATPase
VAGHEEHLWEAELQRIEAELLAFCGSAAERESGYLAALATARRQAAKSLELRAAVGLTRLWTHQGRSGECRELLGPLCASFTEGFETSDVRQATQLLGALHT